MKNSVSPLSMVEINQRVVAGIPLSIEEVRALEPRNAIHYLKRTQQVGSDLVGEQRKVVLSKLDLVLALENRDLFTLEENSNLGFLYQQKAA